MNIVGCLDTPTSGQYILNNKDVSHMTENELADVRNKEIGFVFQTFNLLPRATALENVALPLIYAGFGKSDREDKAMETLENVGLADRADHKPNELSGGQRQRISIARALVSSPRFVVADESVAALDVSIQADILNLLKALQNTRLQCRFHQPVWKWPKQLPSWPAPLARIPSFENIEIEFGRLL